VFGIRLNGEPRLEELRDALNTLPNHYTKLQYAPSLYGNAGGLYKRLADSIPLEAIPRNDNDAEGQLHAAMEYYLSQPMTHHQMVTTAIFGKESTDLVVAIHNGTADVPAAGRVVNDLLTYYARYLEKKSVSVPPYGAPMVHDLESLFPDNARPGFLGWRASKIAIRKLMTHNHQFPASSFPQDECDTSYYTTELSSELSHTFEKQAAYHGVDLMSAFIAANLQSFEGGAGIAIDQDLRVTGFSPAIPNDSMSVLSTYSHHVYAFPHQSPLTSHSPWEAAKGIYNDVASRIKNNDFFKDYHFELTIGAVRGNGLGTIRCPSFIFSAGHNLSFDSDDLSALKIADINYAQSAPASSCNVSLSRWNGKIQISYSFPMRAWDSQEAEALCDKSISLLKRFLVPSDHRATPASEILEDNKDTTTTTTPPATPL
jgi:hypothetical protein